MTEIDQANIDAAVAYCDAVARDMEELHGLFSRLLTLNVAISTAARAAARALIEGTGV